MSVEIQDKLVLVRLTLSRWDGRKLDRGVSREVELAKHAANGTAKVTKQIVDKLLLEPTRKHHQESRDFLYDVTTPWDDKGRRACTGKCYVERFRPGITERLQACEPLVESLIDGYSAAVDKARVELGDMFRESDYPSIFQLRQKHSFDVEVEPVPSGSHIRIDLTQDEIRQVQDRTERRINEAQADIWNRLVDRLEKMVNGLAAYKPSVDGSKVEGGFHNTLVTNIGNLVRLVPDLNVTGDSHIEQVAKEMHDKLTKYSANELKESDAVRRTVQTDAADMLDKMAGYYKAA